MDMFIALLNGNVGVLLGVALGAVLTFFSSWRMARATRDAARKAAEASVKSAEVAADASVRVAAAKQDGERRIRMDDRTYADRRALVDTLLDSLARHELRDGALGALDWGDERVVPDYEAEGKAIVSRMKTVYPSSVTDAATSVVDAAVKAARAKSNASWKLRTDSSIDGGIINPNMAKFDANRAYMRARDAFLMEVQSAMTQLDSTRA